MGNRMSEVSVMVRALEELGFFDLCDQSRREAVLEDCIQSEYVLFDEENPRVFAVDSEDLFEQGSLDMIRDVESTLTRLEFSLDGIAELAKPQSEYLIQIGTWWFRIFSVPEDATYSGGKFTPKHSPWDVALTRTCGALNWVFSRGSFSDELFVVSEENSSIAVLCNYEVYSVLTNPRFVKYSEARLQRVAPFAPIRQEE